MKKEYKDGFTLIELLMVIMIIGILVAILVASLSESRNKSSDAAILEQMINARSQAEVYYHYNDNAYNNLCTSQSGIGAMVQTASNLAKSGAIVTDLSTAQALSGVGSAVCHENGLDWAASVRLTAPNTSTFFCVDSANNGIETTNPLPSGAVTCI